MRAGGGDLRRTVRLFGRFTLGHRRAFAFAAAALAIAAATAVAVPDLIKKLTNYLNGGRPPTLLGFFTPSDRFTVLAIAVAIVLATAVNSASESLADIHLATAARTLGFNLRSGLFAHLQRLPLAFHLRRGTGDVLTRLTGDVTAMEDFVEDSVSDLLGSLMILAATMAYLFWSSWQVALLALAIVPLLSVVSSVFARRIKSASKQLRASEGDLASTAQEMLSTISLVQVYGRGEDEGRKFERQSGSARDAFLRTARLDAVFSFTVAVLEAIGIAVVILAGARLVSSQALTAGDLIAFILLIQNMFKPIRRIIKQWNKVASVYASVERVGELLDLQPTVVDSPNARPAPPFRGEVAFRDVSFAYQPLAAGPAEGGGRLALESLSFRISPGESVALVGHSGAGKSTIAQLLPRLYDPHAGSVTIDGHDIRQFTVDSLRQQMSMVLQETLLLRGTIAENIAYGRAGATPAEVVAAARQAGAHDFVMALPDDYDTVLGERAATLSGGQRQRLSVARAFIRDAPILILDEPTTGLDAEATALVAESLQSLSRNRSTVIVSHDLNLIRTVDRILVLSAGRILQEGSPADLLASGGLYADLYARQFGDAVAAAGGTPLAGTPAGRVPGDGAPAAAPERPVPVGAPERERDTADRADTRTFDALLARAVPQPATREQFLALTGRLPTVRPRSVGDELDALRSRGLARALPGLADALSGATVAPRIQQMLTDDWQLHGCSPGSTFVEPGGGATVQYRVELRRRGSGEPMEHLVAGRLSSTREDAQAWLSQVAPLAEPRDPGDELRPFSGPVLLVPELNLVLHAFPLDPLLPGLPVATDAAALVEMLGPVLTSSVPGLVLEGCHVEVVRYGRGRCVLRYELAWQLQHSRRSLKQVIYGTAYGDDRGRLVGPAVTALRESLDGARSSLPFVVPRFQAYLPDLRLALLEAVPGAPLLPTLLGAPAGVAAATAAPLLTPEGAVAACARIAATLHQARIPVGATRTLTGEVEAAGAAIEALAPLAPALAGSLRRHLRACGEPGLDSPGALGVAHGRFALSRVLFDGPISCLVDFDTVCLAEPALDLGRFTADLALAGAGRPVATGDPAADLATGFLREYLRSRDGGDRDGLLDRVAAFRTVALTRLAVDRWRRLQPQLVRPVLELLDQPEPLRIR